MKDKTDEKLITQYLLGELPEEEQTRIEERFLRDYEYLEHLRAVEEELNDDYVRGELADRERDQFERRVSASPEWRQRVEFARALSAMSAAPPKAAAAAAAAQPESSTWRQSWLAFLRAQNPAFQLSLAAVVIVVLLAGSWLILETSRLRAEMAQLQAAWQQSEQRAQQLQQQTADERARADQLAQELKREQEQRAQLETPLEKPPPERAFLSFILMPGIGRSDEPSTKLVVPQDTRLVRLQLYLQGPTPYRSYQAELRTAEGNLIWRRDRLAAQQTRSGKAVALSLPANTLSTGKYEMTLKGVSSKEQIEDVGYYYFSILKK